MDNWIHFGTENHILSWKMLIAKCIFICILEFFSLAHPLNLQNKFFALFETSRLKFKSKLSELYRPSEPNCSQIFATSNRDAWIKAKELLNLISFLIKHAFAIP